MTSNHTQPELRSKLRELHNDFHGRLRTHEEVARRSNWPPHVLDGVQIEDEEIFYSEIMQLHQAALKDFADRVEAEVIGNENPVLADDYIGKLGDSREEVLVAMLRRNRLRSEQTVALADLRREAGI